MRCYICIYKRQVSFLGPFAHTSLGSCHQPRTIDHLYPPRIGRIKSSGQIVQLVSPDSLVSGPEIHVHGFEVPRTPLGSPSSVLPQTAVQTRSSASLELGFHSDCPTSYPCHVVLARHCSADDEFAGQSLSCPSSTGPMFRHGYLRIAGNWGGGASKKGAVSARTKLSAGRGGRKRQIRQSGRCAGLPSWRTSAA